MSAQPTPRVVAIVQARMGSSRLPGKTLAPLAGRPVLAHVIERAGAAERVDEVWVATTTLPEDDVVAEAAGACGARVYRGAVDDVLDRYHGAAAAAGADVVVRITADDPLIDPRVVGEVVELLLADGTADYASTSLEDSFPYGMHAEAMRRGVLDRAWAEAVLPSEREHVTPYIWTHPERFALRSLRCPVDLSGLRWTLDYPDDLDFMAAVFGALDREGAIFGMDAVLRLLAARSDLLHTCEHHPRDEGYVRSLTRERAS